MIGEELCHRLLNEQYQYVIATHIDHSHIHNHIIVNNTNMISEYTFETEYNQGKMSERAWTELLNLSNDICRENGLSVIEQPQGKGVSHYEYEARKFGISWKEHLRQMLTVIIAQSTSLDNFFKRCMANNIEYVYKPNNKVKLKYRPLGKERFVRTATLGEEYTPEAITESIKHMQNAIVVAKYKATEQPAVTAEPKPVVSSSNIKEISAEEFISGGNSKAISSAIENPPEKKEVKDGWESIRGIRNCADIIADLENVGIHSVGEFTSFNIRYAGVKSELTDKLGSQKKKILALDTLIKKIKHLKELSATYKEYQSLSGLKQKRFRKKNAEAIDDYERTDSYIKSHIKPYKTDGKAPTVKELSDRSNVLKNEYNSIAQAYRELVKVEAVTGKYSREIRNYLNQQYNKSTAEQSRERKQGVQRKKSELE